MLPSLRAARLLRRLACAALILAPAVGVAADVDYALGLGSSSFESHSLDAGVNIGASAWRFDGGAYRARSEGSHVQQVTMGLRWSATDFASFYASLRHVDDNVFRVNGASLGTTLNLNRLWYSERSTTLSITAGRVSYTPDINRQLPAAVLDRIPKQNSWSASLRHAVTADVSLNLGYDRYSYTQDPVALATAVALAFARFRLYPPKGVFAIVGFADHTISAGASWAYSPKLSLDLSVSQTETVISQANRSVSLGFSYSLEPVTLGATVTQSNASQVLTPRGAQIFPSSSSSYIEFRVSMQF